MKKFIVKVLKLICAMIVISFIAVPMAVGFLYAFIKDAFQAGLDIADNLAERL